MRKKIKGFIKSCGRTGTTKTGYQELWDTGRAHNKKMKNKITGINRPSV
jgi:hypothetical protein